MLLYNYQMKLKMYYDTLWQSYLKKPKTGYAKLAKVTLL
jgi:hypothetical protein